MLRLLGTLLLPTSLLAQSADESAAQSRLHPYLNSQMQNAAAGSRLPVYFVIGDQLPREHFFPRVLRMDKETRRATVVRELREHMERTQRDLIRYLEDEAQNGNVEIISRNYLGNFVRVRATAQAIVGGAAVDGVARTTTNSTARSGLTLYHSTTRVRSRRVTVLPRTFSAVSFHPFFVCSAIACGQGKRFPFFRGRPRVFFLDFGGN